MEVKVFSKKEAIRYGWGMMKSNFWLWFGILWFLVAVQVVSALVNNQKVADTLPILYAILAIIFAIFGMILNMGQTKIVLKFCDADQPAFVDLFTTYRPFFKVLLSSILYGLILLGGTILLIVPGIIWGIRFQFYYYLIIDQDLGPVEALKRSWGATKGHTWNLFLFGLLIFLIQLAGFLALIIGLFATVPTINMAYGYVFRQLFPRLEPIAVNPAAPNLSDPLPIWPEDNKNPSNSTEINDAVRAPAPEDSPHDDDTPPPTIEL